MNRKFTNQIETPMNMNVRTLLSILRDYTKRGVKRRPDKAIAMVRSAVLDRPAAAGISAVWFGHSAVLLEIEGKRLLFDPMLGPAPTPVPGFGSKRYSGTVPVEPERLPAIDAVLLSHDHYDHLDAGTIRRLGDKVGHYHVPLGVGRRLLGMGVEPGRISEYQWGDETVWNGLTLACMPARHFSGRSPFDRDRTLWASWVVAGERYRVFFSGDSGYGPHFRDIGERYGPFDLTLMECGQYDERWAGVHMMPEETVQAHLEVRGRILLPIHWGAFTLALHDWTDPVERAIKAARARGVRIAVPRIGESVVIGDGETIVPDAAWWR